MTDASRQKTLGDSLVALRERKRILDAVWVFSLAAALVAVSLPWLLRVADIDLIPVAWSTFAYALVYLTLAAATDRLRRGPAIIIATWSIQACNVLFLAFLWHLAGGMDSPMFLLAFILPILGSGFLMQAWQPFAMALLSVLSVCLLAVTESPDLRWYVSQIGAPLGRLLGGLPALRIGQPQIFADLETGPAYQFNLLTVFAVLQFTAAFLSSSLAAISQRLYDRLHFSARTLRELQDLFQAILRATPEPSLILYADTGQVVQASSSFFNRMLMAPPDVVGKGLFDLVAFNQPERVQQAVNGERGEVPFCVYKVGPETRIANLHSYRTRHGTMTYTYVGFQELTDLYYLRAAFDAIDESVLVLAADKQLLYANHAARQLFGSLHFGMSLKDNHTVPGILLDWWQREEPAGRVRRVEVARHPYEVSGVLARLPGEAQACTILWLRSVEREAKLFEEAVHDPLTGLYNRRYFNEALERQVAMVGRGSKLACTCLDLDDLKAINDDLGHAGGDAALIAFAEAVKGELRATDLFARLGGDEFGILFQDSDERLAGAVLQRIYHRLARPFVFQGRSRSLSCSGGLTACQPGEPVAQLMERTDRALYAAKQGGKGRWVVGEFKDRKAAGAL